MCPVGYGRMETAFWQQKRANYGFKSKATNIGWKVPRNGYVILHVLDSDMQAPLLLRVQDLVSLWLLLHNILLNAIVENAVHSQRGRYGGRYHGGSAVRG